MGQMVSSRRRSIWASVAVALLTAGFNPIRPQSHTPCVVEDKDTPTMPRCVIESHHGALVIPRRYWMYPSFNKYGLAAFTILSFGRVYIDRDGRIVVRDVAFMDSGPDDFHHGLVRIERDGMWGYADPSGHIVVPMKYSCALNCKDQYADVGPFLCVGCRMKKHGEYEDCVGGKWFLTDRTGRLTPAAPPR